MEEKTYYRAFDKKFFKKHQKVLRFLLNNIFFRRWFRWCMRIRSFDCKIDEYIQEIRPHSYTVYKGIENGRIKKRTDVRTHAKYGKRLYYAFSPIWWVMHFLDWLLLDRWIPRFSFGFTTLTVYPDAGTGGTTVDGSPQELTDAVWATIRGAAGDQVFPSSTILTCRIWTTAVASTWTAFDRNIHTYDTSSIGTDDIDDATSSLYGFGITDNFNQGVSLVGSTPAADNNLVAADYAQLGTTRYASDIDLGSLSTGAYNDWTMNATGEAAINKTGITRLGNTMSGDTDNSEPSWASSTQATFQARSADQSGTSEDPKLVINHSEAAAFKSPSIAMGPLATY